MRSIVIALFVVATLQSASAETACLSAADREKARGLMLEGLDAALKQQTIHLFENRLKDREHNPDRIVRGMRNAIFAYARSRAVVQNWSLPACKGE